MWIINRVHENVFLILIHTFERFHKNDSPVNMHYLQ